IPRDQDWHTAWDRSQAIIQNPSHGGILAPVLALPAGKQVLLMAVAVVATSACFSAIRWIRGRSVHEPPDRSVGDAAYEVVGRATGDLFRPARDRDYDLSRRSYDRLDPAGRTLFLVDIAGEKPRAWPLIGNCPADVAPASRIAQDEACLRFSSTRD